MDSEFLQAFKKTKLRSVEHRLSRTGVALEHFKTFEQKHHDFHSHDFVEILFVIRGKFRHITADRTFDETPGGLTILNYNQFHSLKTIDGPVELMNIYLNPSTYSFPVLPEPLASQLYNLIQIHPGLGNKFNQIQHVIVKDAAKVTAILNLLLEEQESGNPWNEEAFQSLFRLLIIEICRSVPFSTHSASSGYSWRIDKVRNYIDRNFTEPVKLEELCRISGLKQANLCRRFREYTGVSTGEYLKQKRLAAALLKLRTSEDKILSIAEECGFSDISRFNRFFRHAFDCTPSAYRRENNASHLKGINPPSKQMPRPVDFIG